MKQNLKKYKILSLWGVIAVLGVLALVGATYAYYGGSPKVVVEGDYIEAEQPATEQTNLGAFPGTDIYQPVAFWGGFGGRIYASSTVGAAYTLTEGDLAETSIFEYNPYYAEDFTLTLPATTTVPNILQDEGTIRSWIMKFATTTASIKMTLVSGTGWNLTTATTSNPLLIYGTTDGSQGYLKLDCYRGPKTSSRFDINCQVSKTLAAD